MWRIDVHHYVHFGERGQGDTRRLEHRAVQPHKRFLNVRDGERHHAGVVWRLLAVGFVRGVVTTHSVNLAQHPFFQFLVLVDKVHLVVCLRHVASDR